MVTKNNLYIIRHPSTKRFYHYLTAVSMTARWSDDVTNAAFFDFDTLSAEEQKEVADMAAEFGAKLVPASISYSLPLEQVNPLSLGRV